MQGRGRGAGVARLQQRLGAATQENARLRRTLRQAEAGVSQLQAELERLRKDLGQRAQRRTRWHAGRGGRGGTPDPAPASARPCPTGPPHSPGRSHDGPGAAPGSCWARGQAPVGKRCPPSRAASTGSRREARAEQLARPHRPAVGRPCDTGCPGAVPAPLPALRGRGWKAVGSPSLRRPCHEDAVSLQRAAGPAGAGGGEPGLHELRQDAAVRRSLAGKRWQGTAAGTSSCPSPCQPGAQAAPPGRATNRSLCESNGSLRSALLLGSCLGPGAVSAARRSREGRDVGAAGVPRSPCPCPSSGGSSTGAAAGTQGPAAAPGAGSGGRPPRSPSALMPPLQPSPPLQPRSPLADPSPCLPEDAHSRYRGGGSPRPQLPATGPRQNSASSTDTASLSDAGSWSSEDARPTSPCWGTQDPAPPAEGCCHPAQHCCKRKLPAFPPEGSRAAEESAPPCPMYRLVLAGDSGTGKSSFLMRLCTNEFRDVSATLGVDFQIKQLLVDGEQTTLQIWDTAGQERYRSIAQSYFRKAHGVLLLYDISSQSSFLSIRQWIEDIKAAETALPLMLVGNKTDLRPSLPEAAGVRTAHGQKLAMVSSHSSGRGPGGPGPPPDSPALPQAHNCLFCETSAKDGTNVVEAVLHLAREVKRTAGSSSGRGVRLDVSIPPPRAAPRCCRA
ncbi:ras-related protein Rab-44-like isoform X3 [Cygnus olor]|uniref:ras-related protein Rab-44-like isoform X3 n=1 Tax=Cygnus olor TaxID=8869 RepID=UPI001ADE7CDF|nr:ras-related protein Rab-44-like isoform X3 [Cygnus olor]